MRESRRNFRFVFLVIFLSFEFHFPVGNKEDSDWFHPRGVSQPESPSWDSPWPNPDQILSPSHLVFFRLQTMYPKLRVTPLWLEGLPCTTDFYHLLFGIIFSSLLDHTHTHHSTTSSRTFWTSALRWRGVIVANIDATQTLGIVLKQAQCFFFFT